MLIISRKVNLIKKNKSVLTILNLDYEIVIIYITTLNVCSDISNKVYLLRKALIAHLIPDKISIEVFNKYAGFSKIFLLNLAIKFLKYISINNYAIR